MPVRLLGSKPYDTALVAPDLSHKKVVGGTICKRNQLTTRIALTEVFASKEVFFNEMLRKVLSNLMLMTDLVSDAYSIWISTPQPKFTITMDWLNDWVVFFEDDIIVPTKELQPIHDKPNEAWTLKRKYAPMFNTEVMSMKSLADVVGLRDIVFVSV